jgi:hypothetical protein
VSRQDHFFNIFMMNVYSKQAYPAIPNGKFSYLLRFLMVNGIMNENNDSEQAIPDITYLGSARSKLGCLHTPKFSQASILLP